MYGTADHNVHLQVVDDITHVRPYTGELHLGCLVNGLESFADDNCSQV